MIFIPILLIIILLVAALITASAALKTRARTALPSGRVVYSDTVREQRLTETLISWRYNLKGRPDYLVETSEGIIPVELKSAARPPFGRAYESHIMQLACYCLLCEETFGKRVRYGLIRYRDGEVRVEYTPKLRARLLSLLEEIQSARALPNVHRNHSQGRRCAGCGFHDVCGEALLRRSFT